MKPAFATALLATAFVLALAPGASAQNQAMAQVDSQLARIKRQLGPRYSESRNTIMTSRRDSMPANQNLNPSAGTYVFAGAGDNDVTGFVVRLYDSSDRVVAADTSGSPRPRFTFTVPTHGTFYRLEMILTGCRQAPCYFGVQPFRRN